MLMRPSTLIATRWLWALFLLVAVVFDARAAEPTETSPQWASLSVAQRQALAPLQRDWNGIDNGRKQKWLEVAARFPTLPAEERTRIQTRMADWARLSPAERASARVQFQETRVLSTEQRQKSWQAYQALPDDERRQLAQRAKSALPASAEAKKTGSSTSDADVGKRAVSRASVARPAQQALVQAKPGATTTTIATRATPPAHHQPGMPKIAATPGFVDPATLLPTRGPQGAAVRAAASGDPAQQP
jgi:hypothetical protein